MTNTMQPPVVSSLQRSRRFIAKKSLKWDKQQAHRRFRRACKVRIHTQKEDFEWPSHYLLTDWDVC